MFEMVQNVMPGILLAAEQAAENGSESFLAGLHLEVLGAVLGAGFIVFGAARGIGHIAAGATDAIARQPEAGQRIFVSMLLAAAFIEGATLLALIVCILAVI